MECVQKKHPKVSIIMPSLNVASYIGQCIDSVVNQTLHEIEIICIDAGSNDGTAELLEAFASNDDRIVLMHSPVKSYGYQMNMGIEKATGEYVGIVETDDFASPDMFENLYRAAKKYAAQVVKSSYYRYSSTHDGQEEIVYPYMELPYNKVFNPEHYPQILMPEPAIWSGLYKREFLIENEISFLETAGAAYQDTSFILKVWFCAERVLILNNAFLHYRIDNENSSVNSTQKVFDICREFQCAQEYLDLYPSKKDIFQGYLLARKEYGYYWNYMRLEERHKPSFLSVYRKDFSGDKKVNKSELKAFSRKARMRLKYVMESQDDCAIVLPEKQGCLDRWLSLTDHSLRYMFRKIACHLKSLS